MSAVLLAFTRKARGKAPIETVILDDDGDPCAPCKACAGRTFHAASGKAWACDACSPPILPEEARDMTGWKFCALPKAAR